MDGVCGCGLALVVLQVASFGTKFLWIFRAKFLFGAEGTTVLQPPATIGTVGTVQSLVPSSTQFVQRFVTVCASPTIVYVWYLCSDLLNNIPQS